MLSANVRWFTDGDISMLPLLMVVRDTRDIKAFTSGAWVFIMWMSCRTWLSSTKYSVSKRGDSEGLG